MSIRTFIFCDICNPQAIRVLEHRRSTRLGERSGRRISDGRSWIEASLDISIEKAGWLRTPEGIHICPTCQALRDAELS